MSARNYGTCSCPRVTRCETEMVDMRVRLRRCVSCNLCFCCLLTLSPAARRASPAQFHTRHLRPLHVHGTQPALSHVHLLPLSQHTHPAATHANPALPSQLQLPAYAIVICQLLWDNLFVDEKYCHTHFQYLVFWFEYIHFYCSSFLKWYPNTWTGINRQSGVVPHR